MVKLASEGWRLFASVSDVNSSYLSSSSMDTAGYYGIAINICKLHGIISRNNALVFWPTLPHLHTTGEARSIFQFQDGRGSHVRLKCLRPLGFSCLLECLLCMLMLYFLCKFFTARFLYSYFFNVKKSFGMTWIFILSRRAFLSLI